MRALAWLVLMGCATSSIPRPVLPPIRDQTIVFGQRIGPVSLGMTEQQLFDAVGKAKATAYGGNRTGYLYAALRLNVVVDAGHVVSIAPTDGSYATAAGLRVGSSGADLQPVAATHHGDTTSTYCFPDRTLVTVGVTGTAVCAAGVVCDIVLGGCTPP